MTIGLIVVVLIEALLMLSWNRSYFNWGVPLFQRRIAAPAEDLSRLPFNWLAGDYPPATWATLVFEPLSATTCGFRETLLMPRGPGYLPIMRGLIVANPRRREVRVVGWCNWSVLLIAGPLVWGLFLKPVPALFLLGILAASYLVQRRRFQNVAGAVAELVARERVAVGERNSSVIGTDTLG
ncbi:MAG TPA: hypothetical protein VM687_12465 [Stenotrophomonas sp.]|nr:hypothetical protein [Stenotrophomonas sp.]